MPKTPVFHDSGPLPRLPAVRAMVRNGGSSHWGVYGPCGLIRCVIEKVKKTARLGIESSAFDGRVLLGLDRLRLNPVSQRHVTAGSHAGA